MDFSVNVATFATGTYTVTRRGATTVGSDGIADLASSSTLSVKASVQPHEPRKQNKESEGMRVSSRLAFYSVTKLRAGSQPDIVSIGGEDYEVEEVFDRTVLGNYAKHVLVKVDRGGN